MGSQNIWRDLATEQQQERKLLDTLREALRKRPTDLWRPEQCWVFYTQERTLTSSPRSSGSRKNPGPHPRERGSGRLPFHLASLGSPTEGLSCSGSSHMCVSVYVHILSKMLRLEQAKQNKHFPSQLTALRETAQLSFQAQVWCPFMLMGSRQEAEALWLLGAGNAWFLVCGGQALMRIFPSGHWGGVRMLFVIVAMFSKSSEKTVREARKRSYLKSCSFGTSVLFPPLESPDLSYPLRGLVSSTCILLDTSDRNPRSEIPRSTVLWGYTDTAGWHPQLSACWVETNLDNKQTCLEPWILSDSLIIPQTPAR